MNESESIAVEDISSQPQPPVSPQQQTDASSQQPAAGSKFEIFTKELFCTTAASANAAGATAEGVSKKRKLSISEGEVNGGGENESYVALTPKRCKTLLSGISESPMMEASFDQNKSLHERNSFIETVEALSQIDGAGGGGRDGGGAEPEPEPKVTSEANFKILPAATNAAETSAAAADETSAAVAAETSAAAENPPISASQLPVAFSVDQYREMNEDSQSQSCSQSSSVLAFSQSQTQEYALMSQSEFAPSETASQEHLLPNSSASDKSTTEGEQVSDNASFGANGACVGPRELEGAQPATSSLSVHQEAQPIPEDVESTLQHQNMLMQHQNLQEHHPNYQGHQQYLQQHPQNSQEYQQNFQECQQNLQEPQPGLQHHQPSLQEFQQNLEEQPQILQDQTMMQAGGGSASSSQLNRLSCEECNFITASTSEFENHLLEHRAGSQAYQCGICGYASPEYAQVEMHYIQTHQSVETKQCALCPFSTVDQQEIENHLKEYHNYEGEITTNALTGENVGEAVGAPTDSIGDPNYAPTTTSASQEIMKEKASCSPEENLSDAISAQNQGQTSENSADPSAATVMVQDSEGNCVMLTQEQLVELQSQLQAQHQHQEADQRNQQQQQQQQQQQPQQQLSQQNQHSIKVEQSQSLSQADLEPASVDKKSQMLQGSEAHQQSPYSSHQFAAQPGHQLVQDPVTGQVYSVAPDHNGVPSAHDGTSALSSVANESGITAPNVDQASNAIVSGDTIDNLPPGQTIITLPDGSLALVDSASLGMDSESVQAYQQQSQQQQQQPQQQPPQRHKQHQVLQQNASDGLSSQQQQPVSQHHPPNNSIVDQTSSERQRETSQGNSSTALTAVDDTNTIFKDQSGQMFMLQGNALIPVVAAAAAAAADGANTEVFSRATKEAVADPGPVIHPWSARDLHVGCGIYFDDPQYFCTRCNYGADNLCFMNSHVINRHPEAANPPCVPHKHLSLKRCAFCDLAFKQTSKLNEHLEREHARPNKNGKSSGRNRGTGLSLQDCANLMEGDNRPDPMECKLCGAETIKRSGMYRHLLQSHKLVIVGEEDGRESVVEANKWWSLQEQLKNTKDKSLQAELIRSLDSMCASQPATLVMKRKLLNATKSKTNSRDTADNPAASSVFQFAQGVEVDAAVASLSSSAFDSSTLSTPFNTVSSTRTFITSSSSKPSSSEIASSSAKFTTVDISDMQLAAKLQPKGRITINDPAALKQTVAKQQTNAAVVKQQRNKQPTNAGRSAVTKQPILGPNPTKQSISITGSAMARQIISFPNSSTGNQSFIINANPTNGAVSSSAAGTATPPPAPKQRRVQPTVLGKQRVSSMGSSVSAICAQAKVIGGATADSSGASEESYTPITISPIVDKSAAAKRRRKMVSPLSRPPMIFYKTPPAQAKQPTTTIVIQQQPMQQRKQQQELARHQQARQQQLTEAAQPEMFSVGKGKGSQVNNAKNSAKSISMQRNMSQTGNRQQKHNNQQQQQQQQTTVNESDTVLVQLPTGEIARVLKSSIPPEMLQHLNQSSELPPQQNPSAGPMQESNLPAEMLQQSMQAGGIVQQSNQAVGMVQQSLQPGEMMQQSMQAGELVQQSMQDGGIVQQSLQAGGMLQQSMQAGEMLQQNTYYSFDPAFVNEAQPYPQQVQPSASAASNASEVATLPESAATTMSAEGGISVSLGPDAMPLISGNFIEIDGQLYQIQEGGGGV